MNIRPMIGVRFGNVPKMTAGAAKQALFQFLQQEKVPVRLTQIHDFQDAREGNRESLYIVLAAGDNRMTAVRDALSKHPQIKPIPHDKDGLMQFHQFTVGVFQENSRYC